MVGRGSASPELKGDVALSGCHHGCIDKREHRNDATHNTIRAEVLHPKRLKHNSRGVERNTHDEEHSDVEEQRILGDAFVVSLCGG